MHEWNLPGLRIEPISLHCRWILNHRTTRKSFGTLLETESCSDTESETPGTEPQVCVNSLQVAPLPSGVGLGSPSQVWVTFTWFPISPNCELPMNLNLNWLLCLLFAYFFEPLVAEGVLWRFGAGLRPHQPGRTGDRDHLCRGHRCTVCHHCGHRLFISRSVQHHNVTHTCKMPTSNFSAFLSKENRIIKEEIISEADRELPSVVTPIAPHSRLQRALTFFMPTRLFRAL